MFKKICIIGCGLIGSSLARAIKNNNLAEKIVENSDDLISKAGLTIIDNRENYEGEYQTGVFIGINGAGYDFYQQHWIPMYKIFGWV